MHGKNHRHVIARMVLLLGGIEVEAKAEREVAAGIVETPEKGLGIEVEVLIIG